MKTAFRFKTVLLLFIVGLGVGILFALQFQSPPSRVLNPVSPFLALQDARTSLIFDQTDLKSQISQLRDKISQQQDALKLTTKNSKGIVEQTQKLKEQVGLVALKDKGLVITLADSQSGNVTIDSIVHAADLRDLTNLLWSEQAQAISINDQRIVATTSIDSIVNTVLVNNTKIANPFVVKVIGDSDKLSQAISASSNTKDILRRQKNNGLIFNSEVSQEVSIPAFDGGFAIKYASIKD